MESSVRAWVDSTSADVGSCAGVRTPATTTLPHAPTAGVGNWPRDEIAEGGAPRVRLALWGFKLSQGDDGGGSAPWSRSPEHAHDADPGSRAAGTRAEDGELTADATGGERHRAHSANAGR